MKRVCFLVLMVALLATAWGEGEAEEGVTELTVLWSYTRGDDNWYVDFLLEFEAENPDIDLILLRLDNTAGSTLSMDALLAAGTPPNVLMEWVGRASKYMLPGFALPLQDVMDLDPYLPGVLDPYTVNGDVLGVPVPSGAQGMAINTTIMDAIGYTVEFDWTVDDFLEMSALVKDYYGGEKWGTGMIAGNQSGDYLIRNWWPAFGADFYAPGDYSRTIVGESGGARVYEFFQLLVTEGYIQDGAATLIDDDYLLSWGMGELAAAAFFPGWCDTYLKMGATQGAEPFEYIFMPFPSAVGRGTPTYISGNTFLVIDSGDDATNAAAVRFVEHMNGGEAQTAASVLLLPPNRSDATFLPDNDRVRETAAIVAANGIMDVGLTGPKFAAIRPLHHPILQQVLNFQLTPEEAIALYVERVDAAIND